MKPIKQVMKLYLPPLPDWRQEGIDHCSKCNAYGKVYSYYRKRSKKASAPSVRDRDVYCKICVTGLENRDLSCSHCGPSNRYKYLASIRR